MTLSFLGVAERHFPTYRFQPQKIDGFVAELLDVSPQLSARVLDEALASTREMLEEYRAYQQERYLNRLNPYTTIRHALYFSNRSLFSPLLFDMQRQNFETWLGSRGAQ
ncbi:MAG: hypothetical protein MRJ92_14585 [Nitrospira sp.]|nr:hypothetical protein [Nitrospira sp.]